MGNGEGVEVPARAEGSPGSPKARMTILIVEDDPVNTRLVGSLLTRWGYEVVLDDQD